MSNIKAENRFKGVNWNPGDSEPKQQPAIDNDMLAISVANHAITQFAKAETINSFNMVRMGSRFKNKPDMRKEFADVLIASNGKKAAVVINKDSETAKKMQKLANEAGYPIFYNCKSLVEFKEWFKKNL